MKIMNYDVFIDELDTLNLKTKQVINTINSHSYIIAKSDKYFKEALEDSDLLIPDGSGIVLAAKFIYKTTIKKISGSDLHDFLLKKMDERNGKIFYMGSSDNTLEKIKEKLKHQYPNITVQTYSPPFKPVFSIQDNDIIVSKINSFKPDILFIGLTAPKQEKWLHEHKEQLHFTIASSIGAVFDFFSGNINRPSQKWIDMHLEWLPRLLNEPKRLWRRNFISTPLFLLEIFSYKINRIFFKDDTVK